MSIINLNLKENSYPIHIEHGLLKDIGRMISEWYNGERIIIISDHNVDRLYGDRLTASLKECSSCVVKVLVEPGEQSKSLTVLNHIYNEMARHGITRNSLVIAFGGGVVGDLAGFAAATFMRGIPYVQIPTTVMSQLDSSIGGKTAVNIDAGKNLVGSFCQPKAVFVDTSLLQTLSDALFSDGLAEAVKYGAIRDSELFHKLLSMNSIREAREHIKDLIYRCAAIKCDIVGADEFDKGERMLLNFGHTIGHGIERYYDFKQYTHGEAVALGMLLITKSSEAMGITAKGTAYMLEALLSKLGLPTTLKNVDHEKLIRFINLDKKSEDSFINLVFLKEIGHAVIQKVSKEEIGSLFAQRE